MFCVPRQAKRPLLWRHASSERAGLKVASVYFESQRPSLGVSRWLARTVIFLRSTPTFLGIKKQLLDNSVEYFFTRPTAVKMRPLKACNYPN